MTSDAAPRLSVIVPTLNEEEALPRLLRELGAQQGVSFEVIIADGGSRDATRGLVTEAVTSSPFPMQWVDSPAGRGRQMNAGARAARTAELLFLHADSGLADPRLLSRALEHLRRERAARGSERLAGHFNLKFQRTHPGLDRAYHYLESKTCLDRYDCIRGDQGLLIGRAFFEELGGFDESLYFLEDVRLAPRIAEAGAWISLPGTLFTSARRFEEEGFTERSTLTAAILVCEEIGLRSFFDAAKNIYRAQGKTSRLDLLPFFRTLHEFLHAEGPGQAYRHWSRIGAYVREQAWQLPFMADCARNFRRGLPPGRGPTPLLTAFERWFDSLTDNPLGRCASMLVAAGIFHGAWLAARYRAERAHDPGELKPGAIQTRK